MCFLIARPIEKANSTKTSFASVGLRAHIAPVINIEYEPSALASELESTCPFHCVIVTSTYAANWLNETDILAKQQVNNLIAVGRNTLNSLSHISTITCKTSPKKENSEGILSLPILSGVNGKKIAIIKGHEGRNLLQSTLSNQGAIVQVLNVYRRTINDTHDYSKYFSPNEIKCVIVTSIEIADAVMQIFDNAWLLSLHWIVISERVSQHLQCKGISNISISDGASNEALLAEAQRLLNIGTFYV